MSEPTGEPLEITAADREDLERMLAEVDLRPGLRNWLQNFEIYGESFVRLAPVTIRPQPTPGAVRIMNSWATLAVDWAAGCGPGGEGSTGSTLLSALRQNGVVDALWPARRPTLPIESTPLAIEPLQVEALPNTRDGWEEMMRVVMNGMGVPRSLLEGGATAGGVTRESVMDALRLIQQVPRTQAPNNEVLLSRAMIADLTSEEAPPQWVRDTQADMDRDILAALNAEYEIHKAQYTRLLGCEVTDDMWRQLTAIGAALEVVAGVMGRPRSVIEPATVVAFIEGYNRRLDDLPARTVTPGMSCEQIENLFPPRDHRRNTGAYIDDAEVVFDVDPVALRELIAEYNSGSRAGVMFTAGPMPVEYVGGSPMVELTQEQVREWTGSPVNDQNPAEGLVLVAAPGSPRTPPPLFQGSTKLVWDVDKINDLQRNPHTRSELVATLLFMLQQVLGVRNMIFDNYKFTLNANTPITNNCRLFVLGVLQPTRNGLRHIMTCRLFQRIVGGRAEWGVQVIDELDGQTTRRPRSYVGPDERQRQVQQARRFAQAPTPAPAPAPAPAQTSSPSVSAPPPILPRPEQRPGIDL